MSIYYHRFCVGDRFYLCENKILCEYDYEERLVFASIGNHPMLKRHANNVAQNPPAYNKSNSLIPQSASAQQHNMMAMEQAQATAVAVHQQQQQQQQHQQKLQQQHDDLNNNSHGPASGAGCGLSASPYNSPHLKIPHST